MNTSGKNHVCTSIYKEITITLVQLLHVKRCDKYHHFDFFSLISSVFIFLIYLAEISALRLLNGLHWREDRVVY